MTSSRNHPHILPMHRSLLHQIGQYALSWAVLRQGYTRAGQGESLWVGGVSGEGDAGTKIGEIQRQIASTRQNR